jgi:cytochrome c oxidase subunit I
VDYPDAFAGWNDVSSVGVYISWVRTLIFVLGVAHAFFRRRQAEATTLKWTLPSPPPFHAFEELPRIK